MYLFVYDVNKKAIISSCYIQNNFLNDDNL